MNCKYCHWLINWMLSQSMVNEKSGSICFSIQTGTLRHALVTMSTNILVPAFLSSLDTWKITLFSIFPPPSSLINRSMNKQWVVDKQIPVRAVIYYSNMFISSWLYRRYGDVILNRSNTTHISSIWWSTMVFSKQ